MGALSKTVRSSRFTGGRGIAFWCPACDGPHGVPTEGPGAWTWNGDVERPTLAPSLRVSAGPNGADVCHFFLRDGRIEYLGDSTHALAGQTIDVPDWPNSFDDGDPA